MLFKNPVYYHLTNDQVGANASNDLTKIIDYLLTFPGDIAITKQKDGSAQVSYTETPLKANLKTTGKFNRQITLTCEKEDNISVNLLKNIINSINYRIFNPQTLSYLVNDPSIVDLTTAETNPNVLKIIKQYGLIPLSQYRDSLIFYAKDKKGKIHLVNRHFLEFLTGNPQKSLFPKDFSVVVAKNIGSFVALFDRGLISPSFYKHVYSDAKVINLSDFDIHKLPRNVTAEVINFNLDLEKQSFIQNRSSLLDFKKGSDLVKSLKAKNYLSIKIAGDIGYQPNNRGLIPKLKVLVFK